MSRAPSEGWLKWTISQGSQRLTSHSDGPIVIWVGIFRHSLRVRHRKSTISLNLGPLMIHEPWSIIADMGVKNPVETMCGDLYIVFLFLPTFSLIFALYSHGSHNTSCTELCTMYSHIYIYITKKIMVRKRYYWWKQRNQVDVTWCPYLHF